MRDIEIIDAGPALVVGAGHLRRINIDVATDIELALEADRHALLLSHGCH